jgi:arylsulfatase
MHWPAGLKATGGVRPQFCHAIDLAPTILDAVGIGLPEVVAGIAQMPVHGTSLTPVFQDPAATIDRGPQYFEMLGHRGIWKDGWKAVTHHEPGKPFDEDQWELYHLADDFSECEDLAAREPAKLKEMVDLWWAEAEKHGVLPLDDRGAFALFAASRRPGLPSSRDTFVYNPPVSHIVSDACPPVARGWSTRISLTHPASGGDGALVARGSLNSGFAIYVQGGRLTFDYNEFHAHTRLAAAEPLTPGDHEIGLTVTRDGSGGADAVLSVDGAVVAQGHIPRLLFMISSLGMDLGRSVTPINGDYTAPFTYPGDLRQVVFDIPRIAPMGEVKAQVRAEMTRQ